MFNSKPFDFQKAGDSDLCTRGLSQTNYKKLDLDDFNLGAYKGSINFWFRDLEFNIKKDIPVWVSRPGQMDALLPIYGSSIIQKLQ